MRAAAILPALLLLSTGAYAADRVPASELAANPSRFEGRAIRLSGMSCVDNPKASFVCVARIGGGFLRVEGYGLGTATSGITAARVARECRGTINLNRPQCVFDVEVIPARFARDVFETPDGNAPIVIVTSRLIDFLPTRR